MNVFRNIAIFATEQKDLTLIVAIFLVLLMMILPLPQLLMDLFITVNVSAAIMIILVSIHLLTPVSFSTFPALLLITTMFRLAISVSTTRLILLEGDAGQIISTFGEVVISGNLIVGLVIFLIITVVQFLVITKGADRVAEVSARFTLDGLPGKQMSVDADLRAGIIDQLDARLRRQALEQETKLFGAMDGAMKFVKGDAIAGLIITVINLFGGVSIGMAQLNLSFSEALEIYSILTIGDGLVAQIPALLISVASGIMVTRVTTADSKDLGSDIADQFTNNRRTGIIAGIIIMIFGFTPGFPTSLFLLVGTFISGGIILSSRRSKKDEQSWRNDWHALQRIHNKQCDEAQQRTNSPESLKIVVPSEITKFAPTQFVDLFESTRIGLNGEFGIPVGYWKFEISEFLNDRYEIYIESQEVAFGIFDPTSLFVRANSSYLTSVEIPCLSSFEEEEGSLVESEHIPKLVELNIPFDDAVDQLFTKVRAVSIENMASFVGVRQTNQILDDIEKSNPTLVADLKSNLSIGQVSGILKRLTDEQLPIKNIVGILESILEWAPKDPNPIQVVEKVRTAIGDHIIRRLAPDGFLPVAIIAPSLETSLRDGLRSVQHESFLVLDAEISKHIASQVSQFINLPFNAGSDPVIITQSDVRRHLHAMLLERGIRVPVVSYQEVPPATTIYPIGFIQAEMA